MKTNTKTKFYWTKKRKQQWLYYKILFWVFMVSVAVVGFAGKYTEKALAELDSRNIDYPKFRLVQEVKAAEPEIISQKKETVEEQIRRIAKEANFQWPDYLVRLAKCENRPLNPTLVNTRNNKPSHSRDRGIFQINDYWHPEVSDAQAFDVEFSTKWTMDRINKGFQHEWMCNRIILKK